jgi:ribosome assembly protein YihI (activator of Der GTPase)
VGLSHRGRISPEEAAWVREHLDEIQQLRSERGLVLLDPADPKTKERCGL